jgi:dTDP-4-dehydrorhamnose reductase
MISMSRVNDSHPCNPEIWGGIECTINRINDNWHDQLSAVGHYVRDSDIGLLAGLGITTLRYPILWERHQPRRQSAIDWTWTDRQLRALRDHRITPIAGLLHHGSGPGFTDLTSSGFADDFAAYAGRVAARFPWVENYTPVNEPLTTARFSGLYGIWFPHHSDSRSFVRMLLHQLEGTVKAMKAIRSVNPAARLIQTEDLARIHSSPSLTYQADFENHRRWLTFDILCGRLDKSHPLWDYLMYLGIEEVSLAFFTDNPCIPDLLGVNYYITSERFLDEDLRKYEPGKHGGNGTHRYADTEAVRVINPSGLKALLSETWERYKLPIAITESHINCTREEQLRWLKETWETACSANRSGIDIRAVTAWAMLGAFDWDSLLTRMEGHYESGAFEMRDGKPWLTAVGQMIRSLADTGECNHPLLEERGWWQRLDWNDPEASTCELETGWQGEFGWGAGLSYAKHRLLIVGRAGYLSSLLSEACGTRRIVFDWQPFCQADGESGNPAHMNPSWQKGCDPDEILRQCSGEQLPWGLISVEASLDDRRRLSSACKHWKIPYMDLGSDGDVTEFLNRFIDMAVAYIYNSVTKYQVYVNKEVHVRHRD